MNVFRSEEYTCNDSTAIVFVDNDNYPGIVEVKVIRNDYNGEQETRVLDFEIDSTRIDDLIQALQTAKEVAEKDLASYISD